MGCQGSKPRKTDVLLKDDAKEAAKQEHYAVLEAQMNAKVKGQKKHSGQQAASGKMEQHRTEMKSIYTELSVTISEIERVLEKYKGREHPLYMNLSEQYDVMPHLIFIAGSHPSTMLTSELPQDEDSKDAEAEQGRIVAEIIESMNNSISRNPGVEKLHAGVMRI